MNHASPLRSGAAAARTWALPAAAAVFLLIRLSGWLNGPELENHDSVTYLSWAEVLRSGDPAAIAGMDADAAPLFPLLTALFSFLTGEFESAARLVSLLASLATMAAVYLIARHVGSRLCGIFAVLLLAVNPEFVRVSYAVLTEPVYIALYCWIVLLFLIRVEKPTLSGGALLGMLAGCAFLTRVEAVLFIVALPLMHLAWLTMPDRRHLLMPAVRSNALLVLVMALVAAPQVIRVSALMNSFALNGRSAWTLILSHPDGKSYDEKLSGLDYDPYTTNLQYLKAHPAALQTLVQDAGYGELLRQYAATGIGNLWAVLRHRLVALVGLPLAVFSIVGFVALLRAGRSADAWLLTAFIGLALVAPLLYQVTPRHLLLLVPLLCVLAAAGIVATADRLARFRSGRERPSSALCVLLLAAVAILPAAGSAGVVLRTDRVNTEYDAEELREAVAIVRQRSGRPTVMARKSYLAHLAGARQELVPYTDLAGLLTYLEAHPAEFLFFEESRLSDYPFARETASAEWQRHFRLVWSHGDGERLALYAVQ